MPNVFILITGLKIDKNYFTTCLESVPDVEPPALPEDNDVPAEGDVPLADEVGGALQAGGEGVHLAEGHASYVTHELLGRAEQQQLVSGVELQPACDLLMVQCRVRLLKTGHFVRQN